MFGEVCPVGVVVVRGRPRCRWRDGYRPVLWWEEAVPGPPRRFFPARGWCGTRAVPCGRASSLQVLWLVAGQGPGGLPARRTRALRRALKISCTRAACAARASVSVRMAGCSCPPSASARIWWIAKTGHRLGSVGVSAVGSGMASICCRPSR